MARRTDWLGILALASLFAVGASAEGTPASEWQAKAKALFGTLPAEAANPANPITDAKIVLGRMLYYEPRISKSQALSCNSCHQLDRFGVDGERTSAGQRGQRGDRNSPTTLNAALHLAQFWDGRTADVEAQAKGPILNPVEMAMPSEDQVIAVLESIPGYAPLFAAAFPGEAKPINYDNLARAIGAFERRLITPAPLDRFIAGDAKALSAAELAGLARFVDTGCTTCHVGPAVGGGMFQKLGLVNPYPTKDPGRMKVTGSEADRTVFKVPSLRNIAKTGPYFHDGSVATLPEAVRLMAHHQLGKDLDDRAVSEIVTFLGALTGTVDAKYVAKPVLPASGAKTPKPDPS